MIPVSRTFAALLLAFVATASPITIARGAVSIGYLHPLDPARIVDTRFGVGGPAAPIGPGASRQVDVTGVGGVPASNVRAVVLNVTAVSPTQPGFLTVYPSGITRPTASNLNFAAGQTIPNLVIVKVGTDGNIQIFNNSGDTHLVVDVVGWYTPSPDSGPPPPT